MQQEPNHRHSDDPVEKEPAVEASKVPGDDAAQGKKMVSAAGKQLTVFAAVAIVGLVAVMFILDALAGLTSSQSAVSTSAIDYENNEIYQGSYFNHLPDEVNLLRDLYQYSSAIDSLSAENTENFTHSTWNTNENNSGFIDSGYWNRKLDYIFSNVSFTSGATHQEAYDLSDHAPVSAVLTLP